MKRNFPIAIVTALLLVSCGGGSSNLNGINGGGVGGINGGGIQGINGGGIALGPITGFGSVIVNGIAFATGGSTITLDGVSVSEAQLKVGQIVEVRGTLNSTAGTGTATSLSANKTFEGPVQAVNLVDSSFVLLGSTVRISGSTLFDDRFANPSLAGLAVGQWVEVHGLRNSSGDIVATRIEPKPAGGEIEINGVISGLDTAQRRFNVGGTTVSYVNTGSISGNLADNACVEVKGTSFTGTTLNASRIEVKNCTPTAANNDVGTVQGFVTRFASASDFDVGGQRVTTGANTTYEDGAAADLALNRRVEVEGTFNASGVIAAVKIKFKRDTSARLTGTVDSINAANRTFVMFGVTITVTNATAFEDDSSARLRPFGFGDLRTSDYLEVRGGEGSGNLTATATLVERDDPDTRRELQAIPRNIAQPSFTLLGVNVTTNLATSFRNLADQSITATEFFGQLNNRAVKVRGTWNGAQFTATEAELENLN